MEVTVRGATALATIGGEPLEPDDLFYRMMDVVLTIYSFVGEERP